MGSTRDKLKRRVRKTVKWGGAGLSVLLVVVWIGSGWRTHDWTMAGGHTGALYRGRLVVNHLNDRVFPGALVRAQSASTLPGFQWWFDWQDWWGGRIVSIPLWPAVLLSLLATAAAWRADAKYLRRVREGACPACGYDRAGLAAGSLCPECGKQPEAR